MHDFYAQYNLAMKRQDAARIFRESASIMAFPHGLSQVISLSRLLVDSGKSIRFNQFGIECLGENNKKLLDIVRYK
ncbi:hypothetical protein AC1031_000711 [Aphanomyces cochlioides]|nr:hypothetical protein AC1031_000711 [Aphanomyces cochlioides]